MRLQFLAPAIIAGLMALTTSCSKDNDKTEPEITNDAYKNLTVKEGEVKEIKYLNANTANKWVYFSFEKGIVEETTATPTTSNWDIAFNRYHVRTNSGTSGSGNGGALNTQLKDFTQVTTASTTASYTVDSQVRIASYQGNQQGGNATISVSSELEMGHGEGFWKYIMPLVPDFDKIPDNQKAKRKAQMVHNKGWLTMDYTSPNATAPVYNYNNWVYIVKTPAGKYAKIQLNDYKNAKGETGYITFKYELANDKNEFK